MPQTKCSTPRPGNNTDSTVQEQQWREADVDSRRPTEIVGAESSLKDTMAVATLST